MTTKSIKVIIPSELHQRLAAIADARILGTTVDEVIVHFTREALHRDWVIQPPLLVPLSKDARPATLPSEQSPEPSPTPTPKATERTGKRLLRMPEVCRQTGLGKSSIYSMIQSGLFPAPKRLGARAVAWLQSEVDAWIQSR